MQTSAAVHLRVNTTRSSGLATRLWRARVRAQMPSSSGLVASVFLLAITSAAANMTAPLYPLYQQVLGLSPLMLSLVYAVYAVVTIPALLVFGPASDARGRVPVLTVGLVAASAGAALLSLATGLAALLAGRAMLGIALGAAIGAAPAAIAEAEPNGDRRRAALLVALAFVIGTAAGPVVTGVLGEYGPEPLRLPYVLLLVVLIPAAVGIASMPRRRIALGRWRPTRPRVPAGIRTRFTTGSAAAALAWAVAALFLALVPSFVGSALGIANLAATGLVVTAMLAFSAVAHVGGRSVPAPRAQAAGMCGLIGGLGALVVAGVTGSLVAMATAAALAGVGHGLAFLGGMDEVTSVAPTDRRGEVIATAYVVIYAAVAIPTVGVGVLATQIGMIPAVSAFAALIGTGGLVLLTSLRARARRPWTRYGSSQQTARLASTASRSRGRDVRSRSRRSNERRVQPGGCRGQTDGSVAGRRDGARRSVLHGPEASKRGVHSSGTVGRRRNSDERQSRRSRH